MGVLLGSLENMFVYFRCFVLVNFLVIVIDIVVIEIFTVMENLVVRFLTL